MKSHMKAECYKREKGECTFCKQKGHLEKACNKKELKGGMHGSLASSINSGDSSEATAKYLVVDSGSTVHVIVKKTGSKILKQ